MRLKAVIELKIGGSRCGRKPVSQEPSSKRKIPHNQQATGLLVMGDFFLVSVIPLKIIFAEFCGLWPIAPKSISVSVTHLKPVPVTQLKPIRIHHLIPCRDEILSKLLFRVFAGINLRNGPQFGV